MTMHHVIGKEDRDLHPAAQGCLLHRPVVVAGDGIEGAANMARFQFVEDAFARHVAADADQPQLADFLLQRHLLDKAGNKGRLVIQQRGTRFGGDRLQRKTGHQAEHKQPFHYWEIPEPERLMGRTI